MLYNRLFVPLNREKRAYINARNAEARTLNRDTGFSSSDGRLERVRDYKSGGGSNSGDKKDKARFYQAAIKKSRTV